MDLEIYGVGAVALIVSLVAVAKKAGFPSKYGGLLALVIGLALAFSYGSVEGWPPVRSIVTGAVVGLMASGAYSTQKNARK